VAKKRRGRREDLHLAITGSGSGRTITLGTVPTCTFPSAQGFTVQSLHQVQTEAASAAGPGSHGRHSSVYDFFSFQATA